MQRWSKFAQNVKEVITGQVGNRDPQSSMTHFCKNNLNLFTKSVCICVWRLGVYTNGEASNLPLKNNEKGPDAVELFKYSSHV